MASDDAGVWGMDAAVSVFVRAWRAGATGSGGMLGKTQRCIAYVGELSGDVVSDMILLELFRRRYGKGVVNRAKVTWEDNGRWMGYGFVQVLGKDLANRALEEMDGFRPLRLGFSGSVRGRGTGVGAGGDVVERGRVTDRAITTGLM